MNAHLFSRALGASGSSELAQWQLDRQVAALAPTPTLLFDGGHHSGRNHAASSSHNRDRAGSSGHDRGQAASDDSRRGGAAHSSPEQDNDPASTFIAPKSLTAHSAGVNALVIDPFEGRLLISGGASGDILVWDLTQIDVLEDGSGSRLLHPLNPENDLSDAPAPPTTDQERLKSHTRGITTLSFYPFDAEAFLSSSYDHTLRMHATSRAVDANAAPTATFDLQSTVHDHAMSSIASNLLVACGTQTGAVRLVDLRSGAQAQTLIGHRGASLGVSWSPRREGIVASAGADGTVRVWDVRRSAGALALLDMQDERGCDRDGRGRSDGRAHVGACTGLAWSPDGELLVSAGLDERIRVWEAATGRNTLVHFGPSIRNRRVMSMKPAVITAGSQQLLLWPNEREILLGSLDDGRILRRLRPFRQRQSMRRADAGLRDRVVAAAWRGKDHVEVYGAHVDGIIRAWTPADDSPDADSDDDQDPEASERHRKRKALDEIHRDLLRQHISFT